MKITLTTILTALLLVIPSYASYNSGTLASVRQIEIKGEESDELYPWCTGTSINASKHYWLTAAHCVGVNPIYIDKHLATEVMVDVASDLAVLVVPEITVKSLKMQTYWPTVGQYVQMYGHPVGYKEPQYFVGHISSLSTFIDPEYGHKMMFDMTACGGNSGSAVLNAKDEVVSVLEIGHGRPCSTFSGGARWPDMVRLVYKYFRA